MNFIQQILTYFSFEHINQLVIFITTKAIIIIAILIAAYMFMHFLNKTILNFCKHKNIQDHTCLILNKAIRYTVKSLVFIFILQNIGVNVSALITALGISGVALSFGMKDTVSNIIAGILIMAYQQFKINDYIKIKDWQGKVIDINIRYTTLQADNMIIFVPNSVLYNATMAIVHQKDN